MAIQASQGMVMSRACCGLTGGIFSFVLSCHFHPQKGFKFCRIKELVHLFLCNMYELKVHYLRSSSSKISTQSARKFPKQLCQPADFFVSPLRNAFVEHTHLFIIFLEVLTCYDPYKKSIGSLYLSTRHGPFQVSPEEEHKNDQRDGTPLLWEQAERIGSVWPEDQKTLETPHYGLTIIKEEVKEREGHIFSRACCNRTRGNDFKLKESRFRG